MSPDAVGRTGAKGHRFHEEVREEKWPCAVHLFSRLSSFLPDQHAWWINRRPDGERDVINVFIIASVYVRFRRRDDTCAIPREQV